ncbi:SIMPL domain-containing protein [Aerosakkonemataceae cyanobacterium BLCC-F154]|uniref:SIMPL domain-containing protein n=1 Tax=Floridaenema fluviatile BLCC-F154 TaxID=3153640 RepID=A0ABV4Y7Z3_9CYAN
MYRFLTVLSQTLVSGVVVMGLWISASKTSIAENPTNINVSQVTNGNTPQLLINQRAITVIGQGQVSVPADTARLEFRFASRNPLDTTARSTPSLTPGTVLPAEDPLKSVIDALVAIEIPVNNIEVQTSALENPKILVKISKPTREKMQEVVKTVNLTTETSSQLFVQGVSAEYAVNNCQPLERDARRKAIRDAETQVRSVALEMSVQLGELLLVTVYPLVSPASVSACGTKVAVPLSPFSSISQSIPPYDPSALPEVQVRSQVSVTYSIK